jgi:hypothetical protein
MHTHTHTHTHTHIHTDPSEQLLLFIGLKSIILTEQGQAPAKILLITDEAVLALLPPSVIVTPESLPSIYPMWGSSIDSMLRPSLKAPLCASLPELDVRNILEARGVRTRKHRPGWGEEIGVHASERENVVHDQPSVDDSREARPRQRVTYRKC